MHGIDTDFVQTDPPAICEAGTFTRTWTATDGYDNTSTFTQTVIISADVTPPTIIVFPQNGSAPCSTLLPPIQIGWQRKWPSFQLRILRVFNPHQQWSCLISSRLYRSTYGYF
ncbi:MAG: hypothetical protein R2778_16115 [Saprospiraceae bacterium]